MMSRTTIATEDASLRENDTNDEMYDALFAKRACCSWMSCLGSDSSSTSSGGSVWWQRTRSPDNKDHWLVRGWKKLRGWSEIAAGPKWKTFIRRFRKNRIKHGSFQYDPLSYALNFDDGNAQKGNLEEDDHRYIDFSARFASIPASGKSSVDLGKDGPTFT